MNLNLLVSLLPVEKKVVVDVGASVGASPAFSLMQTDACGKGLCVEGAAANAQKLREKVKDKPHIRVHEGLITPENVADIFAAADIKHVDVYKQDIDGYDLTLLRALFNSGIFPKILYVEYNEKIPIGVEFEVKYKPGHFWDGSHFFGFSLLAGYKVLRENGYVIVALPDGNNILAVHNSFMNIYQIPIEQLYRQYYLNAPQFWWYPWNADIRHWNNLSAEQAVADIIDYFTGPRKMRNQTDLGQPIDRDTFVCQVGI